MVVFQDHRDHVDTISSYETTERFFCTWLRKSVLEGDVLWKTKSPVACSFGEELPGRMGFMAIGEKWEDVRRSTLIAVVEEGTKNTVVSAYPECDGAEVKE